MLATFYIYIFSDVLLDAIATHTALQIFPHGLHATKFLKLICAALFLSKISSLTLVLGKVSSRNATDRIFYCKMVVKLNFIVQCCKTELCSFNLEGGS